MSEIMRDNVESYVPKIGWENTVRETEPLGVNSDCPRSQSKNATWRYLENETSVNWGYVHRTPLT